MNYAMLRMSLVTIFLLTSSFLRVASASEDDEREAIRAAGKSYLEAVRQGDRNALQSMWTPEGDYVDASGRRIQSKDLFRGRVDAPASDSEDRRLRVEESSLRFITPDVAIEDGLVDFGSLSDGSTLFQRFSVVWVKRDGRWLIDSLREVSAKSLSINDRLSQLSWLLGEWAAKTDRSEVLVSARWSDRGNYLLRDFVVRGEGGETLTGTERIGWDPAAKKIKTWIFDSQGGAGEGYWRRDGDRWIVDAKRTMPDGRMAETSVVYRPLDAGRYRWEVASGSVAEEKLPKQSLEFVRAEER